MKKNTMIEYRKKHPLPTKICKECKKEFTKDVSLRFVDFNNTKYCSMICYNRNKKGIKQGNRVPRIKKKCTNCKREMVIERWDKKRQFCNKDCKKKHEFNTSVIHKKDRILRGKGGICERCGIKTDKLHLHHIKYEYEGSGRENISNYMGLCSPCHRKLHHTLSKQEKSFVGHRQIQRAVIEILTALRVPLDDENFRNTPQRVSRMFSEMTEGLFAQEEIDNILQTKFPTTYSGMVLSKNIVVWSMCPHHLLPVRYNINVGIIFKDDCIGLSKIPRLVKLLAKRPVLQETLTSDIVDMISNKLDANGVICTISGLHTCMQARGVEVKDTSVITSAVRGCFETNDANCKEEFMGLIKL